MHKSLLFSNRAHTYSYYNQLHSKIIQIYLIFSNQDAGNTFKRHYHDFRSQNYTNFVNLEIVIKDHFLDLMNFMSMADMLSNPFSSNLLSLQTSYSNKSYKIMPKFFDLSILLDIHSIIY